MCNLTVQAYVTVDVDFVTLNNRYSSVLKV